MALFLFPTDLRITPEKHKFPSEIAVALLPYLLMEMLCLQAVLIT